MAIDPRNYAAVAAFLLASAASGQALAQPGCYHDGVRLDGTRDGNGQIRCIYQPGQAAGNNAQLERERANLQQRARELEQQLQNDRANAQRIQNQQARRQQEQRDRNAQQWQQLQGMYQREMDRLNAEREAQEAEERARQTQRELEEAQRQLQQVESAAASAVPASTPPGEPTAPAASLTTLQANPFAEAAKVAEGLKDPAADHTGSACSYFTKPMVRDDGSAMNVYGDNAYVCYGNKMYKCTNRRWVNLGRCDLYGNWQEHLAETIEGSR